MTFRLDDRLARDTVAITDLELCHVGLMQDQRFPWLILVPQRADCFELADLSSADRHALMDEVAFCSNVLAKLYPNHCKLNVAALGNMVRQLHVHVIARHTDDDAWPGPVWGVGSSKPYTTEALSELCTRLQKGLSEQN